MSNLPKTYSKQDKITESINLLPYPVVTLETSKNPKVSLTNGALCYPPSYFASRPNTSKNLATYPVFNEKQAKQEIKRDTFNHANYVRRGMFYVHNYNFSNILLKEISSSV